MSLEIERLARSFTHRRTPFAKKEIFDAVSDISFTVGQGELFGLLGPNGAGKTTTIRMLATLLLPTRGVARVAGYDVARDSKSVRQSIGYVFGGDSGFYGRLSARENLELFAEMQAVPYRKRSSIIDKSLELVDLQARAKDRVENFSRGMKQRLHLARGLLGSPKVMFLDEPSIGVDPVAARALRSIVRNLADSGITVLLTTHYLAEADELCGRLAVIDKGRMVACGSPEEIKALDGRTSVSFEVGRGAEDFLGALKTRFLLEPAISSSSLTTSVVTTLVEPGDLDSIVQLASEFNSEGHTINPLSLEDAYVGLVKNGTK